MHEESDGRTLGNVGRGAKEVGYEHEVVVVYPDDVTFLVA